MMSVAQFHYPEVQSYALAGWRDVAYAWAVDSVVLAVLLTVL